MFGLLLASTPARFAHRRKWISSTIRILVSQSTHTRARALRRRRCCRWRCRMAVERTTWPCRAIWCRWLLSVQSGRRAIARSHLRCGHRSLRLHADDVSWRVGDRIAGVPGNASSATAPLAVTVLSCCRRCPKGLPGLMRAGACVSVEVGMPLSANPVVFPALLRRGLVSPSGTRYPLNPPRCQNKCQPAFF